MTRLGVALGLVFAALLGAASVFARRGLERESFDVLLLVSLGVAAPVFLALAAATTGFARTPLGAALLVAVGALVGSVVGRSLYFLGIEYIGPGKSLSISATSPLWAAVLAAVVLGESLTALVAAGTVAVALGVAGISRDARIEAARADVPAVVLLVPAVGAVFAAAAVVLRKLALDAGLAPVEAGAVNMVVGLLVVAPAVAARRGRDLLCADRRALGHFAVASALMTAGFVAYFFGLRVTPASVFFPLVQTQPVFAVGFSALLLGDLEVLSWRTAVGATLVALGASLVVLG